VRLISIDEAKPGMILAKAIYRAEDEGILLQTDARLKQSYIQRIKSLNYDFIYVQDPDETDETDIIEPIKQETRIKARLLLKKTFRQLKTDEKVDVGQIKIMIREMVDQILGESGMVYNIIDIRTHDNYTFAHSVNVCVISLLIGSAMGYNRNDLELLGIGALLHDIGKIFVDSKILNKPSKLDPQEYEVIKKHSRNGYDLLKKKVNISFLPAHVAFQHHEREDGSGYPRGLPGKRIHRFAKIVAVADVFDAMTSHRVYSEAVPTHRAMLEINSLAGYKFDQTVVNNFLKIVAPYPIGSVFLLSNQEHVMVSNVTRSQCMVRVIKGVQVGLVYDLYQQTDLSVIKRLN
jgi:HD-GYP domain-containing protein (c-di-GMP phosphodiesterase class II)